MDFDTGPWRENEIPSEICINADREAAMTDRIKKVVGRGSVFEQLGFDTAEAESLRLPAAPQRFAARQDREVQPGREKTAQFPAHPLRTTAPRLRRLLA